jgi:hypothetical protein
MPIAGWDIRCPRGGELRPGEPYSHRKWPALKWLQLRFTGSKKRFWLADWQTCNGMGLGHGPANERKGPVKGLLIGGKVVTVDRANKRPLGAS